MNRETSFVSSGAESLVWTEMEAKEMFQRHRFWVTYIGSALDPDKQHKGVPPVYLWPEQKRLLDKCKADSAQQDAGSTHHDADSKHQEVDNVNIDLVSDHYIDNVQSKKRKHEGVETELPDMMVENSSNNSSTTDDDNETTKKKRARMSWFGSALNMLQQGFFNTISGVYNWFQQSVFRSHATNVEIKNEEVKENNVYMSTEDVNFSIFNDLRSRRYFVGPGDVYGGDFNIYKGGDPSNSHSAATIRVVRKKRIAVRDLLSFSRVQNHVAKSAVFSFIEPSSNKPAYLIANFRNVSDRL